MHTYALRFFIVLLSYTFTAQAFPAVKFSLHRVRATQRTATDTSQSKPETLLLYLPGQNFPSRLCSTQGRVPIIVTLCVCIYTAPASAHGRAMAATK